MSEGVFVRITSKQDSVLFVTLVGLFIIESKSLMSQISNRVLPSFLFACGRSMLLFKSPITNMLLHNIITSSRIIHISSLNVLSVLGGL